MIILVIAFLIDRIVGFPWEHTKEIARAKQYLQDKYNLTPIEAKSKVNAYNNLMIVDVLTEDHDFTIKVYRYRSDTAKNYCNYEFQLMDYNLGYDINQYIKGIIGDKAKAIVDIIDPNLFKDMSIEEINSDVLFEKMKNLCDCNIILYDNIIKNDYKVNYELNYDIFRFIMNNKLQPNEIKFTYYEDERQLMGSILKVTISKNNFDNINSPDDLKQFFEEVINKIK